MRAGSSNRPSFLGLACRQAVRRRLEAALATIGAVASIAFIFAIVAFVQARPNVPTVPADSEFDGNRAFADLKRLASFGPRPPSSLALGRSREFIVGQLGAAGATVVRDSFTASTPLGPIPMTNLVAKIPGASSSIVIIAGHYDTKRMEARFVGANDGGSSAAFLLEMARVLARKRHSVSYWLVFFDGEEAPQRWSATDGLYGSRHFVRERMCLPSLSRAVTTYLGRLGRKTRARTDYRIRRHQAKA